MNEIALLWMNSISNSLCFQVFAESLSLRCLSRKKLTPTPNLLLKRVLESRLRCCAWQVRWIFASGFFNDPFWIGWIDVVGTRSCELSLGWAHQSMSFIGGYWGALFLWRVITDYSPGNMFHIWRNFLNMIFIDFSFSKGGIPGTSFLESSDELGVMAARKIFSLRYWRHLRFGHGAHYDGSALSARLDYLSDTKTLKVFENRTSPTKICTRTQANSKST